MDLGKISLAKKLSGNDGWCDFKSDILLLMQIHGVRGIVDGTTEKPKPPEGANADEKARFEKLNAEYLRKNAMATFIIRHNLDDKTRNLIRMCGDDALLIWNELSKHFERKSSIRLHQLWQQAFTFRMKSDEDIPQAIARLQTLWVELEKEQLRCGKDKVPENLLIPRILSILPRPEYDEFLSMWDTIPDDKQTTDELIARIQSRLEFLFIYLFIVTGSQQA
jgi:hypothetical protein